MLIEFYIVPSLVGALITAVLCLMCCRQKRPPFWLALFGTPFAVSGAFVYAFGKLLFTSYFWESWGSLDVDPAWAAAPYLLGPYVVSFIVSIGVVFLYRPRQPSRMNSRRE